MKMGQLSLAPIIIGGVSAMLMTFPLAAICALVYRFPIPLGGYEHGWSAVPLAMVAIVFYGVMGGFPLLFVFGAVGGAVASWLGKSDRRRVRRLTLSIAMLVASAAVLILATLDKMIGPW